MVAEIPRRGREGNFDSSRMGGYGTMALLANLRGGNLS